jgi:uncharacterized membrane protein YidH (DUF202 family)
MNDFRPAWYVQELERLESLKERPQDRTWGHPVDALLAVGLVVVLACVALGVFA